MLIGPTAARPGNQSSGAGGYADLLNLQTMTFPSLAFAATVVRPLVDYNHGAILLTFHRSAMPYLRSQRVAGYSKATHPGSTTWRFISESSQPLNPGEQKSSDHYFSGGIGTWP